MKKLTAILTLFLVALGGLTTVQAQETSVTEEINVYPDDLESEDGNFYKAGEQDLYKLNKSINTDDFDLDDLRRINYVSAGDDYVDLYDSQDFTGEYCELNNFIDDCEGALIEYEDDERGQPIYRVMRINDEPYMFMEEETGDLYVDADLISGDPGFEKMEITFNRGLTDYESGYRDGEEDKSPEDAYYEDQTLIVESEDGTRTNFGSSLYNEAYQDGYNDSGQSDFGQSWIMALFSAFGQIFAIELLPGMTIGLLVGITLVPSVVLVFLKLFRG